MSYKPIIRLPMLELNVTFGTERKPETIFLANINKDLLELDSMKKIKSFTEADWTVKTPISLHVNHNH